MNLQAIAKIKAIIISGFVSHLIKKLVENSNPILSNAYLNRTMDAVEKRQNSSKSISFMFSFRSIFKISQAMEHL